MIPEFLTKLYKREPVTYKESGVDVDKEQSVLGNFLLYISNTFKNTEKSIGEPIESIGLYSNILRITDDLGLVE